MKWCQFGNDKLIAGIQSIKMQYQDKFITSGFYTDKLRVIQQLGFADSYGIFYKKKNFSSYCVNEKLLCFVSVNTKDNNDNQEKFLQVINNQSIIQLKYQQLNNNDNLKIRCMNSFGQIIEERKINDLSEIFTFSTPANQLLIYVLMQGSIPIGHIKVISL